VALTFDCTNCGERIVVNHVNIGEMAKCRKCGGFCEVPPDAREIEAESSTQNDTTLEGNRVCIQYHEARSNENGLLADILRYTAWIAMAVGAIGCIALLNEFSQPGPFSSKGNLSGTELLMCLAFGFYHFILGILSLGIAQVLHQTDSDSEA